MYEDITNRLKEQTYHPGLVQAIFAHNCLRRRSEVVDKYASRHLMHKSIRMLQITKKEQTYHPGLVQAIFAHDCFVEVEVGGRGGSL